MKLVSGTNKIGDCFIPEVRTHKMPARLCLGCIAQLSWDQLSVGTPPVMQPKITAADSVATAAEGHSGDMLPLLVLWS